MRRESPLNKYDTQLRVLVYLILNAGTPSSGISEFDAVFTPLKRD